MSERHTMSDRGAWNLAYDMLTGRTPFDLGDIKMDNACPHALELDSYSGGKYHQSSVIERYDPDDVVAWCEQWQPEPIKDALAVKARAEDLDLDLCELTAQEAVEYILHGEIKS